MALTDPQPSAPPGTARLVLSGTIKGEAWANVFWFNLVGGTQATQANFDQWVNSASEAYWIAVGPGFNTDITLKTGQGTLFLTTDTALHSLHSMAHTGADPNPNVNNLASCRVITWASNVYWRGGKPRTYLPGVLATNTTDGKTLLPAVVTAVSQWGNSLHNAFNGVTAGLITQTQHGFVSFQTGGDWRQPPIFFPILSATAHPRIGTQRSRLGPWLP